MLLRTRLKPGETWEDVMAEEIQNVMQYIGTAGCHPIPPTIARTLVQIAYRGRGNLGGHFINAVLNNDLGDAFARADIESEKALHNIVMWLYNVAPRSMCKDPNFPGLILVTEGQAE